MKIDRVEEKDLAVINQITIRSKSYWDYPAEWIDSWREELTIEPSYLKDNQLAKAIDGGMICGFYALKPINEKRISLSYLFIDPVYIGKGIGKALLQHAIAFCKGNGFEFIQVESDPNAERFYEYNGFRTYENKLSSIEDRYLPMMELKI